MGKIEIEIKLNIEFYNAFFFGGGTGNGQIHSYLLRDIKGRPYISGAALKGCMEEYVIALFEKILDLKNREKLFGTAGTQQGCMYFGNGNLKKESDTDFLWNNFSELRTGVSISSYTRAKKEGHLYTMETCGHGRNIVFESSIHGFLEEKDYKKDVAVLVAAARMIFALGGRRSSGLGWLNKPIECRVYCEEIASQNGEKERLKEIEQAMVNKWIEDLMDS